MRIALLCAVAIAVLACRTARPPSPAATTRAATVDEVVRIRCDRGGGEVVTVWDGTVFAFASGEPPRKLFAITGTNVARCMRHAGAWWLTSRELMIYRDPDSGALLDRWTNPWTGETVPVVHVANRVVQRELGAVQLAIADGVASLAIDVVVAYPNPLAANADTRAFDAAPSYRAAELFTLSADAVAALDPAAEAVPAMSLVWTRIGPWLPWMHVTVRDGYLVYSARGRKLGGGDALPAVLARVIDERAPLYRHAPACVVAGRSETSWTYFADHVAEYRAGATFPIAEPRADETCVP